MARGQSHGLGFGRGSIIDELAPVPRTHRVWVSDLGLARCVGLQT